MAHSNLGQMFLYSYFVDICEFKLLTFFFKKFASAEKTEDELSIVDNALGGFFFNERVLGFLVFSLRCLVWCQVTASSLLPSKRVCAGTDVLSP